MTGQPTPRPAPIAPEPAALVYQGHTYHLFDGRILLNWRDRPLSTRPRPCRYCQRAAFFTDEHNRPVHKTCHEIALTAHLLATNATSGDVPAFGRAA